MLVVMGLLLAPLAPVLVVAVIVYQGGKVALIILLRLLWVAVTLTLWLWVLGKLAVLLLTRQRTVARLREVLTH
jgi:hypothetical protein